MLRDEQLSILRDISQSVAFADDRQGKVGQLIADGYVMKDGDLFELTAKGLLEPRPVELVQGLVVGRQRGVGDLDALGGHWLLPCGARVRAAGRGAEVDRWGQSSPGGDCGEGRGNRVVEPSAGGSPAATSPSKAPSLSRVRLEIGLAKRGFRPVPRFRAADRAAPPAG